MLSLNDFKYIEGGCHLPSGNFMRNRMMTADKVADFRKEFNNTGIYLSAYWYDNEYVKEANLYGHFYLDFDNEDDFEKARADALNAVHFLSYKLGCEIPQRFIRVFFSGKKGLHIVVPAEVFGIEPSKELNHYYKTMAEEILTITKGEDFKKNKEESTDLKIYDRRRLFRVVNSIHQKTGLYKVPLHMDELKTATYEEILAKAKNPAHPTWEEAHEISKAHTFYQKCIQKWKDRYEKQFSKDRSDRILDFDPPCVQELLDAGPTRGQRNNTAAALVSHFKSRGNSEQDAWDKIVEWNKGSLDDSELKNVLRSVYHGDYRYGCSTLEGLATCHETCPIKQAQSRRGKY